MKVNTSRFGVVEVADTDVMEFSDGLLGFEHLKRFFIVDPADETLILWLQSADLADVAFPILEPKLFKGDYKVRLSANELRSLRIDATNKKDTLVYCILTIPAEVSAMTANLKAPIVINTTSRQARQVVLQENEYSVKFAMYKELLAVMMSAGAMAKGAKVEEPLAASALSLKHASSKVEVVAL
ncbi:MAG: flagellar assembly protein FliW [Bdellovibrionota bacterium]